MSSSKQKWKLVLLGVPLLILVFVSLAGTAFLAVNLIIGGLRHSAFSSLILGTLLALLWIFMLIKTMQARRSHG